MLPIAPPRPPAPAPRSTPPIPSLASAAALFLALPALGGTPPPAALSLHDSLTPSPIVALSAGQAHIQGRSTQPDGSSISLQVTTASGQSFRASAPVRAHHFSGHFPRDFPPAPPLQPDLLYIDAAPAPAFASPDNQPVQALLIVSSPEARPDLPQPFSDDLTDADGHRDAAAAQWPQIRSLTNLYMASRAARLAGIGQPHFDLANPTDFTWFRQNLSLFDFDHRDRDWSSPLGHRVAAGFWQAVWNTWFNPSNSHPWDGNPANASQPNFRPYTFTNDLADLLVLHQMRRSLPRPFPDHRDALCHQALANLLALQHQGPDNFALPESPARRENYTDGAWRYGLFESGEYLTEGTGWFANPTHSDHRHGGVFLGRALWALGESLRAEPTGPLADRIRAALPRSLHFAFRDGPARGYTHPSPSGLPIWRDPGEHGYLLLGMLAAARVSPDLPVPSLQNPSSLPLAQACAQALDALVDQPRADGGWTPYPDQDAMAIAALADGSLAFPLHPSAPRWRASAQAAADAWLALPTPTAERPLPTPHFGFRQGRHMTHFMGSDHRLRFTFYVSGHWLHALAKLHKAAPAPRYRDRCLALLSYLCGANPFHARLLNELGAVPNFVLDTDGDGLEDRLTHDLYPESSAFVQIGLLHFLSP